MESRKVLHNAFQNIEVGIEGVNRAVGVSQRQLHYWEEKDYTKPASDGNSSVRRYNLSTLYLIVFIKEQLDKGFTLAAVLERSKDIKVKSRIIRTFFGHTFNGVKITNPDKGYGEIDLDGLRTDDGKVYHFKGVVDEHGRYVKIDK